MATAKVSKASKWFSNKSLRLSLQRRGSKSRSTSLSSSPGPSSTPISPRTIPNMRTKRPEEDEMKQVFGYFDGDGDGKISALELRAYFGSIGEYMSHEDAQGKAFEMFELEKGSGCITPKGLQRMLNRLGDAKSYDECVAMIRVYDIDGNGVLDFHEFHQMMA
ncbi:hypothetical protein GOBAR_AA23147 [Gossypium barbadense]|uniref:EF-hand domain-containing protein n=1 Tax=Gossypium barbadense TaxID=3634 RepID=A0A2P5X2H2_GOSBA|nr:hypothetical protein GOBAR_AA23147 [Gossypium barbadense]